MPPLKYAAPIKNLDVLKGTSIIYAWGEIEIFRGMVFHPRYGTRGTRFFHQPIREDVFSRHFFQKVPKSPGTFFSCFICVKIVWKEIKRKHYKQVGMWNFGILQNLCLRWGRGARGPEICRKPCISFTLCRQEGYNSFTPGQGDGGGLNKFFMPRGV